MVGLFFFKDFIYLFLQMGEGKEGGKHQCVRETSNSCFLHSPQPGIEPETQACTLTRNWTGDTLLCRTMPHPVSHTSHFCGLDYIHDFVNIGDECGWSDFCPDPSWSRNGPFWCWCSVKLTCNRRTPGSSWYSQVISWLSDCFSSHNHLQICIVSILEGRVMVLLFLHPPYHFTQVPIISPFLIAF